MESNDGVETILLKIFEGRESKICMDSLNDLCIEESLWALLSDIDQQFFSPMLFGQFEFSYDTIIRLMVDYAWEKCKVSVSSRYSCSLIRERLPEGVGSFALFLAIHSEKRQCFVEKIMQMPAETQNKAMQIIESTRKQIMENDMAEVLAKIAHLEGLLDQQSKKIADRDEQIVKLSSELQTVFNINKQLKKQVSIMEEQQHDAMDELNVTSFNDMITHHNEIIREREQARQIAALKQEQFEELHQKYIQAIKTIQQLQQHLHSMRQNMQNDSKNRQSTTNVLHQTQDSYIFKEVARLSIRQDTMRLQMMVAKKASQKERQKAEQKQEQLGQLYRHLKAFEKKVKKIKAERHPELDSMIRSSRCNFS